MKCHAKRAALTLALVLAVAVPVLALGIGEVETTLQVPAGEHPEGIAFDRDGNLYFGNRALTSEGFDSELRKITPDGKQDTVIATFARSTGSALLGLAVDDDGNIWAAVDGGADNGVWKISSNGKHKQRIAGSAAMDFPNALTFDAQGNLYVTDSGPVLDPVGGAIWRLPRGGKTLEVWSVEEAWAPFAGSPFPGFVLPGANGIAFFPPNSLYVANTEKGQIFRVSILADGSAGEPEAVTGAQAVPTVDGIAVDVQGSIYGVLPGHAVLPVFGVPAPPPVVVVDPATGTVSRVTAATFDGVFDQPLSLAFSTRAGERTELYVTNGDLVLPFPLGPGPSLVRTNAGVSGYPGK